MPNQAPDVFMCRRVPLKHGDGAVLALPRYSLDFTSTSATVTISADTVYGAMAGMETFSQLFANGGALCGLFLPLVTSCFFLFPS